MAGHLRYHRAPWPMLSLGILCGLLIYLVIQGRLDGSQFRPGGSSAAFSSRMLMMNQPNNNEVVSAEIISNAGVLGAIDTMVQHLSTDSSGAKVQHLSQELAKQIADYVVQRLGQQAGTENAVPSSDSDSACSSCLYQRHNRTGKFSDIMYKIW